MPGLPEGYTSVVIASARRARQWQRGLQAMGIQAARAPSARRDCERGSWQIGVPAPDEPRARTFVRHVIEGHASLPASALPPGVSRAHLAIGAALLVLAAAAVAVAL